MVFKVNINNPKTEEDNYFNSLPIEIRKLYYTIYGDLDGTLELMLFRVAVLLTDIDKTLMNNIVLEFIKCMMNDTFIQTFDNEHLVFKNSVADEAQIGRLIKFCKLLNEHPTIIDDKETYKTQIQTFVSLCDNHYKNHHLRMVLIELQYKESSSDLSAYTPALPHPEHSLLSPPPRVDYSKKSLESNNSRRFSVISTVAFKKTRKPHPKPLPIIDEIFQPKLDERVKHYIDLLEQIEWNETTLFPLLCELYWETASDPQLNQRKLLIIYVFNATLKRFDISVRGKMNEIFYTLSNSTVKDGEQIMSLLFLKFILYFATFILNKESSEQSLCESLSHLIGLVGSTDGENILNGGTGNIAAFLENTRQQKIQLEDIIGQIRKILANRSIALPDTISIQTIIPKICRFRIRQLCPGVVTDSDDDDDDMGEEGQLPTLYSGKYKPPQSKPACPYRYKCNRRRDALDSGKPHFGNFRHPPNFIHIEDRRLHWRPGGGSGKSKRTRRRTLSTKRHRTKRRRPSTKRR